MVCQHEHRGVKHGIVTPPPFPIFVGPRAALGPNLLRPMISAPISVAQLLAKASSTPVLPPVPPWIPWNVRVPTNPSTRRVPACPNGCSSDCPSPVLKPSNETANCGYEPATCANSFERGQELRDSNTELMTMAV